MKLRLFSFFTICLLCISTSVLAQSDVTIVLFRHAEKMSDSRDPELSPAGKERAQTLFHMLRDLPVTEPYSTSYKRTTQTIHPFADALDLKIKSYNPRDLSDFADSLTKNEGVILVSGHSNTTPALVSALTGKQADGIDEKEYDNLYIIHFIDGTMVLSDLNYPPFYRRK